MSDTCRVSFLRLGCDCVAGPASNVGEDELPTVPVGIRDFSGRAKRKKIFSKKKEEKFVAIYLFELSKKLKQIMAPRNSLVLARVMVPASVLISLK